VPSKSLKRPGPLAGTKQRHPPWKPVHGAESPAEIEKRAGVVHSALLEHAPYLSEPRFIPAVDRYLRAAAREALLHDYIQDVAAEKGAGAVPSRVWEQATAATRLAAKLGSGLGLDPIGHARIRSLSSGAAESEQSLADLAAEGRAIRERREAAQTIDTTAEEQ
jgi:hypothetical protein